MADEPEETTEGTEAASTADAPAPTEPDTAANAGSTQGASADDAVPASADAPPEEAPASKPEAPAEPQEQLAPKERRQRARAARAAKRPESGPRSAEERQAARVQRRKANARESRARRAKETTKHKSEAHSRTSTPPREHVAGQQKVRQGVVVSDKADKTITVRIDVARRHRRYAKIVRTSLTLHAHDESNDAHIGDTVTVRECRPLSRSKRWRLVGVVERAK